MTLAMKMDEIRDEGAIYSLIKTSKKYNASNNAIIADLCTEFDLTKEEAEEAIKDFEAENN